MKKGYLVFIIGLFLLNNAYSQKIFLKKGTIINEVKLTDSIQETFSLYLPTKFENTGKWPILLVFDGKGKGKQALAMFREAAEKENYILAASNNVNDSLSISKNILITSRMLSGISELLPINTKRVYTTGFSDNAGLASLMPIFFKDIEGVISDKALPANLELISAKNPFHFIGIVGKEDFNYTNLLAYEKTLNRIKFPNNLIITKSANEWPESVYLEKALRIFTLSAMAKETAVKDSLYITKAFENDIAKIDALKREKKLLLADRFYNETIEIYRTHQNVDSLKSDRKQLKKDKLYRSLRRNENASFLKEQLLKEDYDYSLEEDLSTYNYNNLGWWNYQMIELNKFIDGDSKIERRMGKRLYDYLNTIIEEYIEIVKVEKPIDDEALILLSMLKTIVTPKNYDYYLDVIALSAKYEDYGTALFYLEEALKNGFKDDAKLNELEHTSLLRIAPEYNKLLDTYLKKARYKFTNE